MTIKIILVLVPFSGNLAAIILVCNLLEEFGDCIKNLISRSNIPNNVNLQIDFLIFSSETEKVNLEL